MIKNLTFQRDGAFLWRCLLITLTLLSPPSLVHAQSTKLSGRITDTDGRAIPGVNVVIKDSALGVISDSDGVYVLEVQEQNATLVFSFIGYVTQEIPVNRGGGGGVRLM